MTGDLLSSFTTNIHLMGALGFDNLDNTLWISHDQSNVLYQYATDGTFLQSGTPTGLPGEVYMAGEFSTVTQGLDGGSSSTIPEPTTHGLMSLGLAAMMFARRRIPKLARLS
jgi:hypothetical protein